VRSTLHKKILIRDPVSAGAAPLVVVVVAHTPHHPNSVQVPLVLSRDYFPTVPYFDFPLAVVFDFLFTFILILPELMLPQHTTCPPPQSLLRFTISNKCNLKSETVAQNEPRPQPR
jgi:hypothetical protein